jgi:ribose transport system ATP-binding protein
MLDEPTRGVDVGARYEIYAVIRELAGQGSGILLASSDFAELIGLADRVLVLHEGQQVLITENRDLDEERLLTLCYGRNVG